MASNKNLLYNHFKKKKKEFRFLQKLIQIPRKWITLFVSWVKERVSDRTIARNNQRKKKCLSEGKGNKKIEKKINRKRNAKAERGRVI